MSEVIQHPTWDDISNMITNHDVTEMKAQGLDLRSYDEVSRLGHKIYYYLGYKLMPLGNPWSDDWIATYNNWLLDGMPRDQAHRKAIAARRAKAADQVVKRVRKDVRSLDDAEKEKLKSAFRWLMSRDPKTPEEYDENTLCYFSLAGKHWYPVPTYCQHHIYGFLPWHRWQMLDFENALRQAPGCEDITLPYWDIETGEFPELFSEEPFASYTFPIDVYPDFYEPQTNIGRAGTTTQRNSEFQSAAKVNASIANARTAPKFDLYNGIQDYQYDRTHALIRAHDLGHNGSGRTMANQDIAAFDPMFWFFHCNWDRLWWEWQVTRGATTLETFLDTLDAEDDRRWLMDPEMSISDPFGGKNADAIDLNALGVDYAPPFKEARPAPALAAAPAVVGPTWRDRHRDASRKASFKVSAEHLDRVTLRVNKINRVKIAGSFWVVLSIGGQEVGRDGFFQSTFSGNCANCVSQAFVGFEFQFDRSLLRDAKGAPQEVRIEVLNIITGKTLAFDAIGNPTITMHQLC